LSATSDSMLRLQDPPPVEPMMGALIDLIGRSGLRGLDFTVELSIDDAFVFASIVDSLRRRLLSGLATGDEVADMHVDLAELAAIPTEPPTGISWLGTITRFCGSDDVPQANRLTDSLTRLADQGLVETGATAVGLAGPYAGLPRHFAVISSVIELANASGTSESDIRRLGFICLQAGVSDLLTVERIDERIHMETVSADTVVRYIDCLVRTPNATAPQSHGDGATEIIAAPAVQPPPVAAGRTSKEPPRRPTYPPGLPYPRRDGVTPGRSWQPTHLVRHGGIPAWSTPADAGVPTARIDAGVELRLLARAGKWAHIVCSNGWSAWVHAEALGELPSR
jgi:hypothetical protein